MCPLIAEAPCTVDGLLPLHYLLLNGFIFGCTDILTAAPDVLSMQDPVENLYPFLLAAHGPTDRFSL